MKRNRLIADCLDNFFDIVWMSLLLKKDKDKKVDEKVSQKERDKSKSKKRKRN